MTSNKKIATDERRDAAAMNRAAMCRRGGMPSFSRTHTSFTACLHVLACLHPPGERSAGSFRFLTCAEHSASADRGERPDPRMSPAGLPPALHNPARSQPRCPPGVAPVAVDGRYRGVHLAHQRLILGSQAPMELAILIATKCRETLCCRVLSCDEG